MTFDLANTAGLIGSGLMVIAYAYSNMAQVLNFALFNLLNLLGALLLIYSLTIHFNVAAMALETAWAFIALIGLAKALRKGKAS
ncbi:CBU_0592 family membrane protein [Sphingobium mellinum]|uniref:CBU_0592 family membrane protein n=1 Tax=Sphingobium mellinum TaxID=1387166 RepID=UPI0030EB78E9